MANPCILIVDDRPENLLSLEQLLESPDLDIIRADSGQQALEKTLDHEFALILMDVQMPEMDGYETATLLRGNSRTKNIPIIFVTAKYKEESEVYRGYGSGAVDYLFKPIAPDVLISKVKIFLELHVQRQLLEQKTKELDTKVAELEAVKQALEKSNDLLVQLSSRDGLTGLLNRRFFDEAMSREWIRGLRQQTPLTLVIADIDHFKAFNDTYGHVAGDDCLRKVAHALEKSILRDVDNITRYGGEEFGAILPDTDIVGGENIASRMIDAVEALNFPHTSSGTADHITISVGVATMIPDQGFQPTTLIESADEALYQAKASGRNRYKVAPSLEGEATAK